MNNTRQFHKNQQDWTKLFVTVATHYDKWSKQYHRSGNIRINSGHPVSVYCVIPYGKILLFIFTALLLSLSNDVLPALAVETKSPMQAALAKFLEQQPTTSLDLITIGMDPSHIDQDLASIYRENNMQPLWLDKDTNMPTTKAYDLVQVLQNCFTDGLNPDDYKVAEILTLLPLQNIMSRSRLDVLLTIVLGRYVTDMREGSADPCLLDPQLFAAARDKKVDIVEVIHNALNAPDIKNFLQKQAPSHKAYIGLRHALAKYRTIIKHGDWQSIPTGRSIKVGMTDPRLPLICRRLIATGEIVTNPVYCTKYTHKIEEGIKRFQHHFQLEPDGIIGKRTLTALNIPAPQLVRKIILNMERWRWLPHRLNGKRIFVNIAGFRLFGATNERVEISMPVIVGKKYHETPIFTGALKYMVINPYWNIPDSIAVKEMVPHMQHNPNYLRQNHIRIFKGWAKNSPEIDPETINWKTIGKGIKRYRLRQDAGPTNSLGRIKFIFPNAYHVYLHDTPAHQLFKRQTRSFSHGCIRVSRPLDLAAYLLKDTKNPLNKKQLQQLIDTEKRKVILLNKKIPIHILYRTVRVSIEGETFFYSDIYGRDALLARALFSRKPLSQCRYPW